MKFPRNHKCDPDDEIYKAVFAGDDARVTLLSLARQCLDVNEKGFQATVPTYNGLSLVADPKLIEADEPATLEEKTKVLLGRLVQKGRTIVWIRRKRLRCSAVYGGLTSQDKVKAFVL